MVSEFIGSTSPSVGLRQLWQTPVLIPCSSKSKMAAAVVSLPVPLVVGTQMRGDSRNRGCCR